MSISYNKADFEKESDRLCEEQNKYYDKFDFSKAFSDQKKVIRHFIESEDVAKEYVFQGKFYPMAHYEIAKILKTKMKGLHEDEIIKTLYHTLRLGNLYKIDQVNYPYLQKAMTLLLSDLESSKYLICGMDRQIAFLLFEVLNENNADNIKKTNYKEYSEIRKFIEKSNSYVDFFRMRKNSEKFIVFLDDELLLERVKKAVLLFSVNEYHNKTGANFYYWACVLLLILSGKEDSKIALLQLHKQDLSSHLVWVLGTFYKDFQNTEANKELLKNLYETFPHNWIDEYQKKKQEW